MKCDFCGELLKENDKVCPKCGTEVIKKTEQNAYKLRNDIENNFSNTKVSMFFFLIFLPPIGLVIMWTKHPEIKLFVKILITLFYVELFRIICC